MGTIVNFPETSKVPRIRRITQTSFACPSQWEIELDKTKLYVKFRNGKFKVIDLLTDDLLLIVKKGSDLDGVMSTKEMLGILKKYKIAH